MFPAFLDHPLALYLPELRLAFSAQWVFRDWGAPTTAPKFGGSTLVVDFASSRCGRVLWYLGSWLEGSNYQQSYVPGPGVVGAPVSLVETSGI